MRYRIALIVIVVIGLFGCTRGKVKQEFIGTWSPTDVEVNFYDEYRTLDEFTQPLLVEAQETVYTFQENGTVQMKLVDSIKTGKWKSYNFEDANREVIALLFKGEREHVLEVISKSESELTVKSKFATGFLTISFEKI